MLHALVAVEALPLQNVQHLRKQHGVVHRHDQLQVAAVARAVIRRQSACATDTRWLQRSKRRVVQSAAPRHSSQDNIRPLYQRPACVSAALAGLASDLTVCYQRFWEHTIASVPDHGVAQGIERHRHLHLLHAQPANFLRRVNIERCAADAVCDTRAALHEDATRPTAGKWCVEVLVGVLISFSQSHTQGGPKQKGISCRHHRPQLLPTSVGHDGLACRTAQRQTVLRCAARLADTTPTAPCLPVAQINRSPPTPKHTHAHTRTHTHGT